MEERHQEERYDEEEMRFPRQTRSYDDDDVVFPRQTRPQSYDENGGRPIRGIPGWENVGRE